MSNQIEELKKDLDTMIGNSSQLKAEKLYAKGWRKQGEWISVDERLPDGSGYFLVNMINHFGLDFVTMAFYLRENSWNLPEVTHWMPLPEPPRTKGGAV